MFSWGASPYSPAASHKKHKRHKTATPSARAPHRPRKQTTDDTDDSDESSPDRSHVESAGGGGSVSSASSVVPPLSRRRDTLLGVSSEAPFRHGPPRLEFISRDASKVDAFPDPVKRTDGVGFRASPKILLLFCVQSGPQGTNVVLRPMSQVLGRVLGANTQYPTPSTRQGKGAGLPTASRSAGSPPSSRYPPPEDSGRSPYRPCRWGCARTGSRNR